MGIKGWYLSGSEKAKSSYTEFNTTNNNRPESSYTDFTAFGEDESFESQPVRKPAKAAKPAKTKKARPAKVKAKKVKAEKVKPAKSEKVKAEKRAKPEKAAKTKPIKKRAVRQAEVDFEAAEQQQPKKKSKGKVFLAVFGVLTVIVAAGAYAGNYFGIIDIGEFLSKLDFLETDAEGAGAEKEQSKGTDKADALDELESLSKRATKKMMKAVAVDMSHPAYACAEKILREIECDNDVDTAYAIFDWVHSNILYQTVFEDQSYEDAAYMGFNWRSGDCYVYFSCAKMLLDCAGIPNMMVTRYPVVTNGHYWNLVQLNGEWYHCDATVFRDRYEMYFMCTDDEIDDGHHDFDHSLYPERASGYSGYREDWWGVDTNEWNDPYYDDNYDYNDEYYDENYNVYNEDYNDWNDDWNDYSDDYDDVYVGYEDDWN
ncbi:MAG: hypothetical protein IKX20_11930 [Paludibacteraceae bacterium]|nr:hypothetical protein [Paludibacteraceae bacterium]